MSTPDRMRRLERGIRRRIDLRRALTRSVTSLPAAAQIVVAATAGYLIARGLFDHPTPLLAITVTISSLGFARDARPRRVLETLIGILVGVVLSELLLIVVGSGWWQLALVLFVTIVVARAVSPAPGFAVSAAIQSGIVLLLPAVAGNPFARTLDALTGGVLALLVTALIPRDPRRAALRDARTLFSVLVESTRSTVDALAHADSPAAELALARLRRTQALVDDWTGSLDTAISVARVAPLLRRHLPELRAQARVRRGADLAARHLRPIARRVEFLVRDGERRPELAGLLAEIASAIGILAAEVADRELTGAARTALTDLARRLDPAAVATPEAPLADAAVVLMLRPLVVDLLEATGMDADDARALLPAV
jgi:uncharacterized membrane protein YgaE (UPF0421/DUF939 family)